MYRIKIFKVISCDALESTINSWFANNPNIKIYNTDYFRNNGWYGYGILYKEVDVGSDADEVD